MSKSIVIDSGHGGSDSGAIANGVKEKDLTLQISLYMSERLKSLGFKTFLTRSGDTTLEPNDRVNVVKNTKADLCISNHINAGGGIGAEVIYSIHNDSKLAKSILENIKNTGMPIRKIFTKKNSSGNGDYYFMHRNTYPTIKETLIVEYGFVDSKDIIKLKDKDFREKLVEAVIKSICDYFGVKYTFGDDEVKIENTKVKELNSGKVLDGIIIDGKSFVEMVELRKLGVVVNWNAKEKIVEIKLPQK